MGGIKDDAASRPAAPGWYPDPFSATGSELRYFDGKAWLAAGPRRIPEPARPARHRSRFVVGLVAIVVAVGGGAEALVGSHVFDRPSTAQLTAAPTTTPATLRGAVTTTRSRSLVDRAYAIGECVTWDQAQGSANTSVVDCTRPHLIEIMGSVNLDARLHHFPTRAEARVVLNTDCRREVRGELHHSLTRPGFAVSGIYPLRDAWVAGDHLLWCGVVKSPAYTSLDLPFVGRVR